MSTYFSPVRRYVLLTYYTYRRPSLRMWGQDYDGLTGITLISDRDGSNGRVGNKESLVVYGHAFAIYAVAAYFDASGDPAALDFAVDGYNFLNDYAHDGTHGGHYVTAGNTDKDTNVNLHVLEALIEFYQAMPTSHTLRSEVASRISELLVHLHDDAIHCEPETDCFAYPVMNRNWITSDNSVSLGFMTKPALSICIIWWAVSDLNARPSD